MTYYVIICPPPCPITMRSACLRQLKIKQPPPHTAFLSIQPAGGKTWLTRLCLGEPWEPRRQREAKGHARWSNAGLSLSCSKQTDRQGKIHSQVISWPERPRGCPSKAVLLHAPGSGETITSCQGTPCSQQLWAAEKHSGLIATYLWIFWGLLHQK